MRALVLIICMALTLVSGVLPSTHAQAMPMTTMSEHHCCDSSDAQPMAERHTSTSSCEHDSHACDNCAQHCFAHAGLISISPSIQLNVQQGAFVVPTSHLLESFEGILRPPKA